MAAVPGTTVKNAFTRRRRRRLRNFAVRADIFGRFTFANLAPQLPLILLAYLLIKFRFSDQGLTLATQPKSHPWIAGLVVFFVTSLVLGSWAIALLSPHWNRRLAASRPVSPEAAGLWTVAFGVSLAFGLSYQVTSVLVGLLGVLTAVVVTVVHQELQVARLIRRGQRNKMLRRSPPNLKAMKRLVIRLARHRHSIGSGAFAILLGTQRKEPRALKWVGGSTTVHGISIGVAYFLYSGALLLVGMFVATTRVEWFTALGPEVTAYAGLACLSIMAQALLVILPTTSDSWKLPAVVVLGLVGCILVQDKLTERPNPLLEAELESSRLPSSSVPIGQPEGLESCPKEPEYLISAEGGGMRAAYWTAMLLQNMADKEGPQFLSKVRLLSGVSGGSVGIATWVAAQELPHEQRAAAIEKFLSQDFLSPLVAGLLFVDAPRLVISTRLLDVHRGDLFELVMARRWKELTGKDFFYRRLNDLQLKDAEGKVYPSTIYFNATDALSGASISLGNRQALPMPGQAQPSALNLQVQNFLRDIRVAQGAHTSARFVYLSPHPDLQLPATDVAKSFVPPASAAKMPSGDARAAALVDGGYFDNSGLGPAITFVQTSTCRYSFHVIHIVNDQARACGDYLTNAACLGWSAHKLELAQEPSSWGWLTRPFDAIMAVRGEHSVQRINEIKQVAFKYIPKELPPPGSLTPAASATTLPSVVPASMPRQKIGAGELIKRTASFKLEDLISLWSEDKQQLSKERSRETPVALGWWLGTVDVKEINEAAERLGKAAP